MPVAVAGVRQAQKGGAARAISQRRNTAFDTSSDLNLLTQVRPSARSSVAVAWKEREGEKEGGREGETDSELL